MRVRLEPRPSPAVSDNWPEPARPEAFAGFVGEFIQRIAEQTEADPHSILFHGLAMFGNVIGRSAHFVVNETRHFPLVFVVIVGQTSSGRKGMARDIARSMMATADLTWPPFTTGLSSGEGLIHIVRDPSARLVPAKEKGKAPQIEELDAGVKDKRAMVIEPEFGAVLQIMKRAGNTVSAVLRQAWDGETLQVASRNTAARATEPHISIVGHITLEELLAGLDDTSLFNGFANRFVWPVARRSRHLPDGGSIDQQQMSMFRMHAHDAVRRAKKVETIRRSPKADQLWADQYPRLTDERPGLIGAVTARAAPYVMRFACLYALLDKSATVRTRHLRSALALWDYCDASARHVFGVRVGQRDADKILRALRSRRAEGLTRTEIFSDVFQRHRSKDEITRSLEQLATAGVARQQKTQTDGRPEERWFAR